MFLRKESENSQSSCTPEYRSHIDDMVSKLINPTIDALGKEPEPVEKKKIKRNGKMSLFSLPVWPTQRVSKQKPYHMITYTTPLQKISGEGNEDQIMESLRRYQSRPTYVQRALFHLFNISQTFLEPRTDVIKVNTVLWSMQIWGAGRSGSVENFGLDGKLTHQKWILICSWFCLRWKLIRRSWVCRWRPRPVCTTCPRWKWGKRFIQCG